MTERETLRQLLEETDCEDVETLLGWLSDELLECPAEMATIVDTVHDVARTIQRLQAVINEIQIAPSVEA